LRLLLAMCIPLTLPVTPTLAGSISFVPAGAQIDADPIFDIVTAPGAAITFVVSMDTMGLTAPLQSFSYSITWDPAELAINRPGIVRDPGGHFPIDGGPGPLLGNGTMTHTGGAVAAGAAAFVIDQIPFTVLAPVDDGARDFEVAVFSANYVGGGSAMGQYRDPANPAVAAYQQVEVQPVPEPASIALILAGLAFRRWAA
jgi:hypothetical protein